MSTGQSSNKQQEFVFLDPKYFSAKDLAWFRWQLRDTDVLVTHQPEGTWLATQKRPCPTNNYKLPEKNTGSFMQGWKYFMDTFKGMNEEQALREREVRIILARYPAIKPPPFPRVAARP